MNKEKTYKFIRTAGIFFLIFLAVSLVRQMSSKTEKYDVIYPVPAEFSKQLSNVTVVSRISPMPDASFIDKDGHRLNWKVFRGKYVLVNFWASWCPPCVMELPSLDKLHKKYEGKNISIIAISLDQGFSMNDITTFLGNRGISDFAAYMDDASEIQSRIYMRGIPTTYLLDPDGNITHIFEGDADWNSSAVTEFFDSLPL